MTPDDRVVVISQAELGRSTDIPLAEYRDACWAADVWTQHCHAGMHLRAIHYALVALGSVTMAPGVRQHEGQGRPAFNPVLDAIRLPYENTPFCWSQLQKAAKAARYWRLVDARALEEHRSPEPDVNAEARETPTPDVFQPSTWPKRGFPEPTATGYDYEDADQPIDVEVWCEKSTMDDVLAPLCRALHVNYQPLMGFFSITRGVEMLCRLKKPAIILYVSDLDAAGCRMPTAFAKALAHYAPIYAPGIDIRLKQIALTEDQVIAYRLPRNVIDEEKASSYNRKFRVDHPLGPCELDALEAVRPGELEKIVRAAVAPYFDKGLYPRLHRAHAEAQQRVDAAWAEQTAEAREALTGIEADMTAIRVRRDEELAPYERIIAAIRAEFDDELQPYETQRADVRQRILEQTIDVELPERPEPDVEVPDDEWLVSVEGSR